VRKRVGGKAGGFGERARRLRHRAEWAAAVLVLLSAPTLWLLVQQAGPASVSAVIRPVTQEEISPPQVPEPAQNDEVPAEEARGEETGECDDPRVLVDREHALPADYAPDDLVSLPGLGIPILGREALLRQEAAENLDRLVAAAAADGEALTVSSAYRSYEDQRASYARLVSVFGRDADKTSAPPGHSQHQLGTAVDFTNGFVGYELVQSFGRTSAARWLQEHAHEYGFVLAYPPGRGKDTGYHWEPWHYRYVGAENARRVREGPLDLQGYLKQEGVMPSC
jgi:zinc D-Ala-D-Ala carboxypeptidase